MDADELLARLGAASCVFCSRLSRGKSGSYQVRVHDGVAGEPCSRTCEKEIYRANNAWYSAREEEGRRQAAIDLKNYQSLLKVHEPSSEAYLQAREEYSDDLEYAYQVMGNGIFGRIED